MGNTLVKTRTKMSLPPSDDALAVVQAAGPDSASYTTTPTSSHHIQTDQSSLENIHHLMKKSNLCSVCQVMFGPAKAWRVAPIPKSCLDYISSRMGSRGSVNNVYQHHTSMENLRLSAQARCQVCVMVDSECTKRRIRPHSQEPNEFWEGLSFSFAYTCNPKDFNQWQSNVATLFIFKTNATYKPDTLMLSVVKCKRRNFPFLVLKSVCWTLTLRKTYSPL